MAELVHGLIPRRPATSFLWFTSPLKTFKHIIWKFYKWHIILGILLVLAVLVIVIMVYTAPVRAINSKSVLLIHSRWYITLTNV